LIITGLSPNTAYWFDIQVERTGGIGSVTTGVTNVEATLEELLY
jgi:hypothetical protein